jgi:hypothetical protein
MAGGQPDLKRTAGIAATLSLLMLPPLNQKHRLTRRLLFSPEFTGVL